MSDDAEQLLGPDKLDDFMPRGFVWAVYMTDDFTPYALQVDADYADHPERGWAHPAPAELTPLPRGWKARKVRGYDSFGAIHEAIVGRHDADLWSGIRTTFTVEASDGTLVSAVVFQYLGEQLRPAP